MTQRDRCYGCFRPRNDCFCDEIPAIQNKTDVLILQHRRERFHPFNTARIVRKALQKSRLLVGGPQGLAAEDLPIQGRTGLLYPGPAATLLSDLPKDQHPGQLVILDGTWHHAKTMFRDIPALHALPQYKLAPDSPGRYRIRKEPDANSLSTLEAVVAALRALEPATIGLDRLLDAFETMVGRQLACSPVKLAWRRNERREQTGTNVPQVLMGDLDNIVVAYGESAPGGRGSEAGLPLPVYWIAQRLDTNQGFASVIHSERPFTDTFLGHLELAEEDLSGALSHEAFRAAWADFLAPTDTLIVYHYGTLRLLSHIGGRVGRSLVLKSIRLGPDRSRETLEERLHSKGLSAGPIEHSGRAGRRLAQAIAWTRHLNALGGRETPRQSE